MSIVKKYRLNVSKCVFRPCDRRKTPDGNEAGIIDLPCTTRFVRVRSAIERRETWADRNSPRETGSSAFISRSAPNKFIRPVRHSVKTTPGVTLHTKRPPALFRANDGKKNRTLLRVLGSSSANKSWKKIDNSRALVCGNPTFRRHSRNDYDCGR